jgi:hypothetical protein
MSSLQQRVIEASSLASSKRNDINHKQQSFETSFSAGLDLTEFGGGGGDGVQVHSASEDLALQKANDAARRNREEKAEADLEQRVADVVYATKTSLRAGSAARDVDIPLAVHPNNTKTMNDEKLGNYRDDNYVQFQNNASISGGFLSCLVSNHKKEEQLEAISHKSRQLMNQRKMVNSVERSGSLPPRRQLAKSSRPNHSVGKTALAKKSRKTKY